MFNRDILPRLGEQSAADVRPEAIDYMLPGYRPMAGLLWQTTRCGLCAPCSDMG